MSEAAVVERGYHHGNLRQVFLAEARKQLEKVGRNWVLREASRVCKVSSGAVFRHFSGREEIEAALVEEGFKELLAATEASRPEQVGYLAWACANPQLYSLMLSPGMSRHITDLRMVKTARRHHLEASIMLWDKP